jgi:hypothetical protein
MDAGQGRCLDLEKERANRFVMNWPQGMLKRLCVRMQFWREVHEK